MNLNLIILKSKDWFEDLQNHLWKFSLNLIAILLI